MVYTIAKNFKLLHVEVGGLWDKKLFDEIIANIRREGIPICNIVEEDEDGINWYFLVEDRYCEDVIQHLNSLCKEMDDEGEYPCGIDVYKVSLEYEGYA